MPHQATALIASTFLRRALGLAAHLGCVPTIAFGSIQIKSRATIMGGIKNLVTPGVLSYL